MCRHLGPKIFIYFLLPLFPFCKTEVFLIVHVLSNIFLLLSISPLFVLFKGYGKIINHSQRRVIRAAAVEEDAMYYRNVSDLLV